MGKAATNHWFIPSKMLDFLISLADLDLHNLPNPGLLVAILGVSVFGPISPMDDTCFFQIQGRGKRRHSPTRALQIQKLLPNFTSAIYVTSTFFCRFCLNFHIVHSGIGQQGAPQNHQNPVVLNRPLFDGHELGANHPFPETCTQQIVRETFHCTPL